MAPDGHVYVRIGKGMYGLKQAAILAYQQLVTFLTTHGYYQCAYTTGLWRHNTRKTTFCLCVDNFGVKYFNKDNANHLIEALKQHYKITVDWSGRHYCGMVLDWNYEQGFADTYMPKYIPALLQNSTILYHQNHSMHRTNGLYQRTGKSYKWHRLRI